MMNDWQLSKNTEHFALSIILKNKIMWLMNNIQYEIITNRTDVNVLTWVVGHLGWNMVHLRLKIAVSVPVLDG